MAAGVLLTAIALVLGGVAVSLLSQKTASADRQIVAGIPPRRTSMQTVGAGLIIAGLLTALVETLILKLL